jgi:hypothetical protein
MLRIIEPDHFAIIRNVRQGRGNRGLADALRRRSRAELLQPSIKPGGPASAGSCNGSSRSDDHQEKGAYGHDVKTAEEAGVAKHEFVFSVEDAYSRELLP